MVQLDDLDDDCLMEVLERMSPEELFKIQRLNKRMKRLAGVKIGMKIKVISLFGFFPKCTHLSPDQVPSPFGMMTMLKLNTQLIMDIVRVNRKSMPAKERAFLLDIFSKCSNVKCLDFELPGDLYLEVFQRCPEIECIKIGRPLIKEDDWNRVLDLFGHRLVHVWNDFSVPSTEKAWYLAKVAEKCPNIKQIDWNMYSLLNSNCMAAIKRLPKSCWVNIKCYFINDNAFEDVIDELELYAFSPAFINRTQRLSILRLSRLLIFNIHHNAGTEFVNLKKLEFRNNLSFGIHFNNFILASRFPRLEELCFKAKSFWREDNFEAMFARMTTIKRLNIACEVEFENITDGLPGSAIRRLVKLETIAFKLSFVPRSNQQAEFLQKIEYYIEEVKSLKTMIVEPKYRSYICLTDENKWQQEFKDGIERLKWEQSRVAVEFRQ